MAHVRLVSDQPNPELEQAVFRIRHDALLLRQKMTPQEVWATCLILEKARDDLSQVLERAKGFKP